MLVVEVSMRGRSTGGGSSFRVQVTLVVRLVLFLMMATAHIIFTVVLMSSAEREPYIEFLKFTPWLSFMILMGLLATTTKITKDDTQLHITELFTTKSIPRSYIHHVDGGNGIAVSLNDHSEIETFVRDSTAFNTDRYLLANMEVAEELNSWVNTGSAENSSGPQVTQRLRPDLLKKTVICFLWSATFLTCLYIVHPVVWHL